MQGALELSSEAAVKVCYVLDAGYAAPTLISVTSLLHNAYYPVQLHFFTIGKINGFAEDIELICREFNCEHYEISILPSEKFDFEVEKVNLTSGAFAKLAMLNQLKGRWIYIDGDTLILDDLNPLFTLNIDGSTLGIVLDYSVQKSIKVAQRNLKIYRFLGQPPPQKYCRFVRLAKFVSCDDYFNSGVMLLDCERIRQNEQFDSITNITLAHGAAKLHGTMFPDQCWLNHHLSSSAYILPQHWNVIVPARPYKFCFYFPLQKVLEIWRSRRNPKILHYAGRKPWTAEFRMKKINSKWVKLYDDFENECFTILGRN